MLFLLPLVFSVIFGGIGMGSYATGGEKKPKVAIVLEACQTCNEVAGYLKRNQSYEWEYFELQVAKDAVEAQSIIAAIIIPQNITERLQQSKPVFDVIVNNKTESYLPLSHYIDGIANQLHMYSSTLAITDQADALKEVINAVNQVEPVNIKLETFQERGNLDESNSASSMTISVGFAVMFMMFAISNSASNIHQERKEYSWQRLFISGTSNTIISVGTMLAYFIIGWMQFATVITFMHVVFNVNWGNIVYLILFGSLMIMTVVSFSLLLVTLVNSKEKADTLSIIIVVSTCMLGGVYWPIDFVPPVMQMIGAFTPQYWMMKGLGYGLLDETRLTVIWQPITILSIIVVLFSLIVINRLSKEKKLA